jgi:hypothetical protein
MYKIAIVGLGPAGILLLAHLPPEIHKDVIVFEPSAVGGALATEYGAVVANITKTIIITAFRAVPRWASAEFKHLEKYSDAQCPLLSDVVKQFRELIAPDLRSVAYHTSRITKYERTGATWKLTANHKLFEVQKLALAVGAVPKILDLPTPVIPLPIALNPPLLSTYVSQGDAVVVFGTAHSGTLALQNLRSAGVKKLTGIYKGATPFQYARDGFSEGIKQESATIADDLVAARWADLIPLSDFSAAHRAVAEATAVVYAIGFTSHGATYFSNGEEKPFFSGGSASPEINAWGFGIGYPSPYTGPDGKQYPDVGFGGFVAAIQAALPIMLKFDS